MDKKLIFAFLAGSALGVAGAQIPGAEVRAAISQAHRHVFQGTASAGLKTTIETGLATQAAVHANGELGLTGVDQLSHADPAQCPIERLNLQCDVVNGVRRWKWEYATQPISGTWSVGAPQ